MKETTQQSKRKKTFLRIHYYSTQRYTSDKNQASLVWRTNLQYQVYAIGEKYGIAPLKELAQSKTENIFTMEWSPTYLFTAINEVYESTIAEDRGLRDVYIQVAAAQGSKLFENKEFEEVMDQTCQFWKDYCHEFHKKYTQAIEDHTQAIRKYTQVVCHNSSCNNEFSTSKFTSGYADKTAYCPSCGSSNSVSH
jgi:hypothetical protein